MINKVILVGNLGRDPETDTTASGHPWTRFSLATHRRWNDREGQRHEETDWHQVTCWGRLAEIAAKFLAKGRQVYVEGRLRTSSWEDEASGQRRYRTEVVGQRIQVLGGSNGAPASEVPPELAQEGDSEAEEEIPF